MFEGAAAMIFRKGNPVNVTVMVGSSFRHTFFQIAGAIGGVTPITNKKVSYNGTCFLFKELDKEYELPEEKWLMRMFVVKSSGNLDVITEFENLLKFKGCKFSALMYGVQTEGVIQIQNGRVYLCQNTTNGAVCKDKLGFIYSFSVEAGSSLDLERERVTNLVVYKEKKKAPEFRPVDPYRHLNLGGVSRRSFHVAGHVIPNWLLPDREAVSTVTPEHAGGDSVEPPQVIDVNDSAQDVPPGMVIRAAVTDLGNSLLDTISSIDRAMLSGDVSDEINRGIDLHRQQLISDAINHSVTYIAPDSGQMRSMLERFTSDRDTGGQATS